MNKKVQSKVTMIDTVVGIIEKRKDLLKKSPALDEDFKQLKQYRDQIKQQTTASGSVSSGTSLQKAQTLQAVREMTIQMANYLNRMAFKTKNQVLEKLTSAATTKCSNQKEAAMIEFCRQIQYSAEANVEALGKLNVTAEEITQLKTLIDSLQEATPQLLAQQNEVKSLRQANAATLSVTLEFMRKCLDVSVRSVQKFDADFVNLYENTRNIQRERTRSRQIEVLVKSSDNGAPIINATVVIDGSKVQAKTDSNGIAKIKTGKMTEMDVIISKDGFKPSTQRVDFVKLKSTVKLEFVLEAEKGLIVV